MIISNPLAVESKWVTYFHLVQNPIGFQLPDFDPALLSAVCLDV